MRVARFGLEIQRACGGSKIRPPISRVVSRRRVDARLFGFVRLRWMGPNQPCRIRSCHAGPLLLTAIIRADRSRPVADALMSPDVFSGRGSRIIANSEARDNSMSCHKGSIRSHDSGLIAKGLSSCGFLRHVGREFDATIAAAGYRELRRLRELYRGFRRRRSGARGRRAFCHETGIAGHRIRTVDAEHPAPKRSVSVVVRSARAPTFADQRRQGRYRTATIGNASFDARCARSGRSSCRDDIQLIDSASTACINCRTLRR